MLNKTQFKWLWIVFCFAAYFLIAFPSLEEPFMTDNVSFVLSAQLLNKEIQPIFGELMGYWHPRAYVHFLALIDKLLDLNPFSVRLLGILCFFISLILIFEISLTIFRGNPNSDLIARTACLLYSINPLALRGSLIVDIDNSILNVALLFFIHFLILDYISPRAMNIFWGGFLFMFVLWTKLTTPIILIFACLIYLLLTKDKGKLFRVCLIFLIGIGLFIISWRLYCLFYKKQYLLLLTHLFNSFSILESKVSVQFFIITMARTVVSFLLWISPFFIIVFYLLTVERIKRFLKDKKIYLTDLLLVYSVSIFLFYLLIGGYSHGVLKYYYPITPILSILAAAWIAPRFSYIRKNFIFFVTIILLIVIYDVILVGDPIYTSYYALREVIIRENLPIIRVVLKGILQIIFLLMPFAFVFYFSKRIFKNEALAVSLIILITGNNLALNITQSKAGYNTVYCYGARGTKEVVEFLKPRSNKKDFIFAPNEIIWGTNPSLSSYKSNHFLKDAKLFLEIFQYYQPVAVVYGISSNTIKQYQQVFNNKEVQSYLKRNFIPYDIGSYTVWLKK